MGWSLRLDLKKVPVSDHDRICREAARGGWPHVLPVYVKKGDRPPAVRRGRPGQPGLLIQVGFGWLAKNMPGLLERMAFGQPGEGDADD
jgi:hypothetical protein